MALVGPAHPYKGGIAQHTTALAHRLTAAGHDVEVWSWKRQYPQRLYPGEQRVPGSRHELEPFPSTSEPLSWDRPFGWIAAGRRAREMDAVILTWTTPIQGPAYLGLLAGLRRHAAVVGLCHNVLPHEPRPGDKQLTHAVLGKCAGLLVHSSAQAAVGHAVAPAARVATSALPPPPLNASRSANGAAQRRTLLQFGLVRPYKGVDRLLKALASPGVPSDVRLIVAGEFWTPIAELEAEVARLGLRERVDLRPGYVSTEDMPALFAEADAVVLPYLSGTASIVTDIAHGFGLPAIVTDVGTLAASTTDGVDGFVVPPADTAALSAAIAHLYAGTTLRELTSAVQPSDADGLWTAYVAAVESLIP